MPKKKKDLRESARALMGLTAIEHNAKTEPNSVLKTEPISQTSNMEPNSEGLKVEPISRLSEVPSLNSEPNSTLKTEPISQTLNMEPSSESLDVEPISQHKHRNFKDGREIRAKKTGFLMKSSLYERFRAITAHQGVSMNDVIDTLVTTYCNEHGT